MASVTMPELRCRQQEGRSAPHASSPQPSCKRSSYGLSNMEVFRKVGAIAKDRLASFGLTRFLSSLLWGVSTTDPWALAAAAVAILTVGSAACFLPARHAAQVDPLITLRCE